MPVGAGAGVCELAMRPSASVSPAPTRSSPRQSSTRTPAVGLAALGVEDVRRDRHPPRHLRACTRCARAISSSSARTSRPSRTTSSPPMYRRSTRCGREDEAGDRVVGAAQLEPVGAPDGDVGALARLERADVVAAEHPRAAARAEPQRLARPSSPPAPPRPRATSSACLTSKKRSLRSFDAEPSTPRPTRTPASRSSRTGATPAPRRRFEVGQCATPTPLRAERAPRRRRKGGRSARTRRRRRSSRALEVLDRACSRRARGSTPPPRPSRPGACAAAARACARAPPTRPSAPSSPRTASRARRRSAPWRRRASPASRSVSARIASIVLDELVGRQAALGLAEVHRAARGDEAHAELARRLDLGLDDPGDAAREE